MPIVYFYITMENPEELKCAIIAMARLENNYINEWIDWHLNLGFDAIIVVDDSREGEPKLKEVVNNDKVTIIEGRDLTDTQASIYTKLYKKYKDVYDWIAFIDIDEFINVNKSKYKNIKKFLIQLKFKYISTIILPSVLYGDNGLIEVKNNDYSVVDRFKNPIEPKCKQKSLKCKFSKSIYNCVRYNYLKGKITGIHFPIKENNKYIKDMACDPNGTLIDLNNTDGIKLKTNISANDAWINHYFSKTITEFLENKWDRTGGSKSIQESINRRNSAQSSGKLSDWSTKKYRDLDVSFFRLNEKTQEKIDIYINFLKSRGLTPDQLSFDEK